jgi:hypothetical protein
MPSETTPLDQPIPATPRAATRHGVLVRFAFVFASLIGSYLVIAYLVLPMLWSVYVGRHPALANLPGITYTHDHHPGDPINLGARRLGRGLKSIMQAVGWSGRSLG